MWYLYLHPDELVVRLHSVLNLQDEDDLPEDFPKQIVTRNMEYLDPDTADRRFLGMAITRPSRADTPVVIRIVRSDQAAPFTEFDEQLLRFLARAIRKNDVWVRPVSSLCPTQST
jgi:hypothetical protein